MKQFLQLPHQLYSANKQWVPPLSLDAQNVFNRKHNPYYLHSEAAFFLAIDDNDRAIGRLAVLDNRRYNDYNHENTAFFYLFECQEDPPAALSLFNAGFQWAKSRHLDKIVGPKGFTPLDGIGLLIKGFEHRPAFGLPYHLPYYAELVEAAGFLPAGDLVSGFLSGKISIPEKIHQIASLLVQRRGLTVSRYNTRRDLRKLAPRLLDLYNNALEGTTGTVPLTTSEAKAMADQMLWFANPRLIKIVLKAEQPIGFLFAYPDISAALQRTRGRLFPFGWVQLLIELHTTKWININGAGMIKGYRGLGGTALLFSEMHKSVTEEGYEYAELVQIGLENDKMQRELKDLGVDFYKTHRLYERSL